MLGRVLGLVRDLMITNQFGTSVDADRAVFVITIPDVMINILIGGAMGAALIPEFKRRNAMENWALYRQANSVVFGIMLVVTGVLVALAEPITRTLVSGLPESAVPGTARLVQICLWAVPVTSVSAVVRAMLQGHDRFAVASLAGFIYNLLIVAGLAFAGSAQDLRWLAIASVAGAGLSLVMQFWDAWRFRAVSVNRPKWQIDFGLVWRYIGALMAGSMVLILPVAMRGFASTNGVGGQTIVYLASKLVDLPMGTLLTVVSIAMFPAIAEALAKTEGSEEAVKLARQGIGVILALAVPIALGIGFFSSYFSDLLYLHGDMTEKGSMQIAEITGLMMIGLVPQAVTTMLLAIYNGLRDMLTPFLISFLALLVFLGLGFVGMRDMTSLAWLYVGFHWVILIGLIMGLGWKHRLWIIDAHFGKQTLVRIIASGLVFAVLYLPLWFVGSDSGRPIVGVLMGILCGGVAFVAGLLVDREIMRQLKGVISRKMSR